MCSVRCAAYDVDREDPDGGVWEDHDEGYLPYCKRSTFPRRAPSFRLRLRDAVGAGPCPVGHWDKATRVVAHAPHRVLLAQKHCGKSMASRFYGQGGGAGECAWAVVPRYPLN
eukprot:4730739-Prymnesium_polylepis.1